VSMSKKDHRNTLQVAAAENRLVRLARTTDSDAVSGYVVEVGPELFLMCVVRQARSLPHGNSRRTRMLYALSCFSRARVMRKILGAGRSRRLSWGQCASQVLPQTAAPRPAASSHVSHGIGLGGEAQRGAVVTHARTSRPAGSASSVHVCPGRWLHAAAPLARQSGRHSAAVAALTGDVQTKPSEQPPAHGDQHMPGPGHPSVRVHVESAQSAAAVQIDPDGQPSAVPHVPVPSGALQHVSLSQ
jgi:hypothetical protein